MNSEWFVSIPPALDTNIFSLVLFLFYFHSVSSFHVSRNPILWWRCGCHHCWRHRSPIPMNLFAILQSAYDLYIIYKYILKQMLSNVIIDHDVDMSWDASLKRLWFCVRLHNSLFVLISLNVAPAATLGHDFAIISARRRNNTKILSLSSFLLPLPLPFLSFTLKSSNAFSNSTHNLKWQILLLHMYHHFHCVCMRAKNYS